MEILNHKRNMIFDVGFVDTYIVHEETIRHFKQVKEKDIFRFVDKQHDRTTILFPYNFR
jgi:predicted aldo/keto reductase-like oxidoreductase